MKQIECDKCRYIFEIKDDAEFGYCPCCENDQVEVDKAEIILLYTEKPLATGGVIKQSTLDKIMQDINKGEEK